MAKSFEIPFKGRANWIWTKSRGASGESDCQTPYLMACFRKSFQVPACGGKLTVHVSADSRYVLYLNGERIYSGPAKGDIRHQFYDTLVLDSHLQKGENILAAIVTCYAPAYPDYTGRGVPSSYMTAAPAFILDGMLADSEGQGLEALHTDRSWSCRSHISYAHHAGPSGLISGLGENLDYSKYPEGWLLDEDCSGDWHSAVELAPGMTNEDAQDSPLPYRLMPRLIPLMEEEAGSFKSIYRSAVTGMENVLQLICGGKELAIPDNAESSFLLDAGELATAYPLFAVRGGAGALIRLTYSEALYENGMKTGRHVPENGDVEGLYDEIRCDGRAHRYEPLEWRTFRYVKVEVKTNRDPLYIRSLNYRSVGYPLALKAEFASSDPRHAKLWEMTFRTLRLCCHDTYEDCPYYEQLQYAGDTQMVSLVTGYMTGDWRLTRQAVLQFLWSIDYEGIPKSRYPSRIPQHIPSWALLWTLMVYEYWWHTGDLETAKTCISGVRSTFRWFESFLNRDFLLENLPYWKVVDWVKEWNSPPGCPPGAHRGVTGLISCQFAYCLKVMLPLLEALNLKEEARYWEKLNRKLVDSINVYCWDEDKGLYKDSPDHTLYSELGNAWAILSGCADRDQAAFLCTQFGVNPLLARATLYGRYYVFRALEAGGRYDRFAELLDWWHVMMDSDLTTWPEEPWLARSYCHAWSCSPGYEFLSGVLGVKPRKAGFEEILIAPRPCGLDRAKGKVPVPGGVVEVEWEMVDGIMQLGVKVPKGLKFVVDAPLQYFLKEMPE